MRKQAGGSPGPHWAPPSLPHSLLQRHSTRVEQHSAHGEAGKGTVLGPEHQAGAVGTQGTPQPGQQHLAEAGWAEGRRTVRRPRGWVWRAPRSALSAARRVPGADGAAHGHCPGSCLPWCCPPRTGGAPGPGGRGTRCLRGPSVQAPGSYLDFLRYLRLRWGCLKYSVLSINH